MQTTDANNANLLRVRFAGMLLLIGPVWVIIAIALAESLTPGYNVSKETISGLGLPFFSTICNTVPDCLAPIQPASAIFVSSLFLFGILQLWSGYLLRGSTGHPKFVLAIVVSGIGAILVGTSYLPFYLGASTVDVAGAAVILHIAAAQAVFVLIPLAAISTYRFIRTPLRYFSLVLGVVALASTIIAGTGNYLGLGFGGIERMIAYPLFIWQVGFGAYILRGLDQDSSP